MRAALALAQRGPYLFQDGLEVIDRDSHIVGSDAYLWAVVSAPSRVSLTDICPIHGCDEAIESFLGALWSFSVFAFEWYGMGRPFRF